MPDVLTLDLGNTRTKACLWEGERVARSAELPGDDLRSLEALLDELGPARGALSSVADAGRTAAVAELFAARRIPCAVAPPSGLENRTLTPETVGLDRLYAGRGALAELGGSLVVCDLGTALTVDFVEAGPFGDFVGAFLGGAIAPGPELGARALAEHTARLPEVRPRPGVPALGRDTRAAIGSGCAVGVRGAARELVERISEEAGVADAPVCVTGGGRAFLLEPEPFCDRVRLVSGELVHRGLLEAAAAVLDG